MGDHSKIQWTEATWNPTTGCTKVSPGCANCYIERTVPFRRDHRSFVKGEIAVRLHEDRLDVPLRRRKPTMYFVNSLSDLFHEDVPDAFIDQVFAVMALTPQHTYQILTKRAKRMRNYLSRKDGSSCGIWWAAEKIKPSPPPQHWYHAGRSFTWPLPHVWLGVSVENQHFADERIPLLLETPAAVRFISAEPLLGPTDISFYLIPLCECETRETLHSGDQHDESCPAGGGRLDWVICGGESGPGARPFDLAWARSIRDQCRAAGVPFFLKQLGPAPRFDRDEAQRFVRDRKGGDPSEWPEDLRVREMPVLTGQKAAR